MSNSDVANDAVVFQLQKQAVLQSHTAEANIGSHGLAKHAVMFQSRSRQLSRQTLLPLLVQGGSYEGEWRGGDREGMGIRTMRSGKVLAGTHLHIF